MNYLKPIYCLLILGSLFGCGSDSTSPTPTPAGTAVSLTTFKGIANGTATAGTQVSFTLSGSDTQHNTYTGSLTAVSDGQKTFDVQITTNVGGVTQTSVQPQEGTKSELDLILTKGSGSPVSSTTGRYFLADGTYYMAESTVGSSATVTYTVTSQAQLPDTVHVGDSGNYAVLSKTDGTDTVTWRLDPDYNGNSKLVFSTVTKDGSNNTTGTEDEIFYLDANGGIFKVEIVSTIVGGVTVTLAGNKN